MGYFVKGKEIAKISPKARSVSLSASPNYVQFESKESTTLLDDSTCFEIDLYLDQNSIFSNPDFSINVNHREKSGAAGFVIGNETMDFRQEYIIRIDSQEDGLLTEKFPNDIILYKNDVSYGIKSFANRLRENTFVSENYIITECDRFVNIKAKEAGKKYALDILEAYFYVIFWDISTGEPLGPFKIGTKTMVYPVSEVEGILFVNQPSFFSLSINADKGYDFFDAKNSALGEHSTVIPLNKGNDLNFLLDYITKSKIRINPYTAYFKEDNGNIYRFVNYTRFAIKDKVKGIERWFQGIDPIMKLSGAYETSDYTYELSEDPIQTAQNLKEALLRCPYVRDNFKVSSPINLDENTGFVEQSAVVNLESLSAGKRFNFEIVLNKEKTDDNDAEYDEYKKRFDSFALIKLPDYDSVNPDTINEGAEACEIQIDMYADTGLFLGQDDRPDADDLGSYVTTLTKTYFNQPVWFDLNSIQTKKYKPPFGAIDSESELQKSDAGVWFDAATYSDRRFVAKRVTSAMSESFYYSPVLYTLTGYERNLDQNDIEKYVYDMSAAVAPDKLVQPLTLQPDLSHVRGQIQYFNFVLKDRDHTNNQSNLGLEYELLSQSGALLDTVTDHQQAASQLNVVNTIALDIDRFADQYANLGIVRVRLCRDGQRVSEPLTLNIQPSYLYRVHDFVFLNSLGGWSSFNFGDQDQLDFKTTSTTFFRNQTPSSTRSSSIETVYSKAVEERFVVRTQPITLATADWLKEISTSIAVFERKSQRYVVVDELNVKYTSQDNFVRLEMKYHYSDSFNAQY
ncbi:hypothetical protein [Dysgonomonas massiliensis]|uniref:hypothetical protein n=1 Tax=Dysgonomonas massiliensis TaxID=2040292 RepID=UPI000C770A59|nr:hypothetical protein [Dysgonomonas massiliensis]